MRDDGCHFFILAKSLGGTEATIFKAVFSLSGRPHESEAGNPASSPQE